MVWIFTVIRARSRVRRAAAGKIHKARSVLKLKFCSHLFMANQAIGQATRFASKTGLAKSRDNI